MIAIVIGGLLAAAGALAGCPAGHSDYPGTACQTSSDCYIGELCTPAGMCVPYVDMAIVGDFAHLPFGDGGNNMTNDLSASDMTSSDDL